jgi:cystathionine gamma-lyase
MESSNINKTFSNVNTSSYQKDHDNTFKDMGFSTKCIHMGAEPDFIYGSVNPPIHLSTTFAQTEPGKPFGPYDYSRGGNPTRTHLERLIAGLESGEDALIWSSGMAAMTGIIHMLAPGDEVICIDDVYGGTQRYFNKISALQQGVKFKFISFDDLSLLQKTLNEKTKLVVSETTTNPTLKVTDIKEMIKVVKNFNNDIIVVVDNTFMSPYNCRPLELGADIVMESATKYIGGHSDVLMGITSTRNKDIHDKMKFIHKNLGGVPSPFECFLAIRGLKTLSIRVERQNSNALAIAKFLETHKNVEKVIYPGLESNKYHKIAKQQQKGFGGVVSFVIKGGISESKKLLDNLNVFLLAESLGSVESLIDHPALMTHASVPEEVRKELGILDGFFRLAVGIEDIDDLIKDLDYALNQLSK